MADSKLKIENRMQSGKAPARRLRRTGKIPAVIYGEDQETTPLVVDLHEFELMLKEHHTIIELELNGKTIRTIVRDIQRHPVTGNIIHVDFFTVKAGHKLTLAVDIKYVGTAAGTKTGGIFQTVKNVLNISVLPKDIPDYIEVDITELEVGDNIRLKDVSVENVELLEDPEDVLCSVLAPKAVEEPVAEEEGEEEEEAAAEPEVITARDKEEEAESEAE
jgi:large subunit ribosomal protein L25